MTGYLLRGIAITRPNQVWAMDITYIPRARGFVYLAVVLDWFSRRVLSWRVSITMEAAFCVETLEDALGSIAASRIMAALLTPPPMLGVPRFSFAEPTSPRVRHLES